MDENKFREALGPEYTKAKVVVWFADHARPNQIRTQEQGRPCFDSCIYYHEKNPKDSTLEVARLATERDFQRYPEQYERYLRVHAQRAKPRVKMLPGITVGEVKEMHAADVYSLDQLLQTSLPEWAKWRELAQRLLAAIENKQPEPAAPKPRVMGTGGSFDMEVFL